VELKEFENIVRSFLLNEGPSSHRFGQISSDSFSSLPEPDESFDFPGGCVAIEYEAERPVQSVQKYWWLLNKTDFLPNDKKLSLVVIMADADAQPKDQVERQKKLAQQLEGSFPGRFRSFFIGGDDVSPGVVSAALGEAYDAIKA
jgi:hypothetical protein